MIRLEDYIREIQAGILLIADHLARLKDDSVAAAFAGFEPDGRFIDQPPERVDLYEFMGAGQLVNLFSFATGESEFTPSPEIDGSYFEENALVAFLSFVSRTDADGKPAPWPDDPLSQQILDMFRARMKLEDPALRATATFTVRELALLADMSQGAVRNALSAKELSSKRVDKKVVVDWDNANTWLSGKRGFRRSPTEATPERALETATTVSDLLAALGRFEGAADALPPAWCSGNWSGDLNEVMQVARALNIDLGFLATRMSQAWVAEQN